MNHLKKRRKERDKENNALDKDFVLSSEEIYYPFEQEMVEIKLPTKRMMFNMMRASLLA